MKSKKNNLGAFRTSIKTTKKEEEMVNLIAYLGIGYTMIFFLLNNFNIPYIQCIYAITLLPATLIYAHYSNGQKQKHSSQSDYQQTLPFD